jgi:hypothetical protein
MSRTDQEVAAIRAANAGAQPGDVLIVAALPGTGKTTLLQQLAKEAIDPTILLQFNRKPSDEFQAWLTNNGCGHVAAYTFHKLAFDAVSESGVVMNTMEQPPKEIKGLLAADDSIPNLLERQPDVARIWYDKAVAGTWSVTTDVVLHWMAHASALPELLDTPTLKRLRAARRVYCDEAQDCSASMIKILKGCTNASLVLAGDSNQAINTFMGSVDPIGKRAHYFPHATVLPLSQTYRYHDQIAAAFNEISGERCIGRPGPPDPEARGDTVVLCGTNKEVDAALAQLRAFKVEAYKKGEPAAGVGVFTVHHSKGFGYTNVVVMRLRRGNANLAATAVSRARERLFVHWSLAKEYGVKTTSHVKRFGELRELRGFF